MLISGAFPNYEFKVIRPNVEITGSYLRLISPSDCTIEPAADEITANTARFAWTFNSRTPSGTFNFGQISPVVHTANGDLFDDSRYPFDVVNVNGETSTAVIEQWALTDASTQDNAAFTFTATVAGVLDGVPARYPNSNDTRLLSNVFTIWRE